MPSVVLTLEALTAGYKMPRQAHRAVVGPVSLALHAGQMACLLGPNGAGKSTLMRTMAGLQPPLSGAVLIHGVNVSRMAPDVLARTLSVVLTDRVTAGQLTAYDAVALGRHPFTDWTGRLRAEDHAFVERSLLRVGADGLAQRFLGELSDGERQRVMVARALAQDPVVMILDEITAFLDLPRRVEIMQLLKHLAHDDGRTILLSTHDLDLALHTADTLWLLRDGQLTTGVPEELVLGGVFETAFPSPHITFDRRHGAFRARTGHRGRARVSGDTAEAHWTRRALERLGFVVGEAPAGSSWDPEIDIVVTDVLGSLGWRRIHADGSTTDYAGLTDLLEDIGRPADRREADLARTMRHAH